MCVCACISNHPTYVFAVQVIRSGTSTHVYVFAHICNWFLDVMELLVILQAYVTAINRFWHPEHFLCFKCKRRIQTDEGFSFDDNRVYCTSE